MAGKNYKMANKGQAFEELIKLVNDQYENKGVAKIQKVATPWKIINKFGQSGLSAVPGEKSTLDFRGTVKPGISISFDAKETEDLEGLPLKNLEDHQYRYIKSALGFGEVSFLLVSMKKLNKFYAVPGYKVVEKWEDWKANPRKKGFNKIKIEEMIPLKQNQGYFLNYLEVLDKLTGQEVKTQPVEKCVFCNGSGKIDKKPCWNCNV